MSEVINASFIYLLKVQLTCKGGCTALSEQVEPVRFSLAYPHPRARMLVLRDLV